MKIDEKHYPILRSLKNNFLITPQTLISENEWDLMKNDIELSLKLFKSPLTINYITKPIHEKLKDRNNFIKAKQLLKDVPETFGLIILPEKFRPKRVRDTEDLDLNDYEFDSVLYAYIKQDTHDINFYGKIDENDINTEENREYYFSGRWLITLPIQNGQIKYALRGANICVSEEFGVIHGTETEDAYGDILDYILSFLILYNFTETDNKIIFGLDSGKPRKVKIDSEKFLNDTKNNIEIIDANYFTKIIRTGEFGVSGHFRLQSHGKDNELTKLIYIEPYKKNGYTREAKQELKK